MDFWFTERHTEDVQLSIRLDKHIFSEENDNNRIDIFESPEYGKILTADGYIVMTEKDEFIYHEMMTHIPMAVHPNPRRILVFGAGDGGVVRELLKYPEVERIDMVEVNTGVVEAAKKYLPFSAGGLDDPKVTIHQQNALRYIRHIVGEYDVIIIDSAGYYGPGESLLSREFYGSCYKALKDDGIMVNQHQSPFYDEDRVETQNAHKRIVNSFPISRVYQAHIPSYPSGYWLFGFASKKYHPTDDLDAKRWNERGIITNYYTTNLHRGSFALPAYVERLLKRVE
ncbi:polyamine aminopropyltransferase [Prevotella sp. PINT]|jgi:spermidine synthase|uniref:polyamine aminopropyltransferase n=1 Tax=Palleniella intestinalis TaxID=2736291 RepID=UPI001554F177|nr:polyamine aminopropyltransferase [Palleniella intestinalis]NPD81216.1 polyamine aminopropyltransferase [Palleniella intestinalis]